MSLAVPSPSRYLASQSLTGQSAVKQSLWKIGLLLVVIVVAGYFAVRAFRKRSEPPPDTSDVNLYGVLAQETRRVLKQSGRVVVIMLDPQEAPHMQAALTDFTQNLDKLGGVTIVGTETITMAELISMCHFPAKTYFAWLNKHRGIDGFVSLIGTPLLEAGDLAKLPPVVPKCIAVSPCGTDQTELFQAGVLSTIIIRQASAPPNDGRKLATPQERFDYYYKVVRADTVGTGQ